jgi:hypothetical protein
MTVGPRLSFRSGGSLIYNDQLARGWRVGPNTACYIGSDRFDWYGAAGSVRVSVFPAPSDRTLVRVPEIVGHVDGGGISWSFTSNAVQVEVEFWVDDAWNPVLSPKLAGYKTIQFYYMDNLKTSSRWYRIQLHARLDFGAPKRDLVWWQRCSKASAGLPSLGKRR